ncbi:zincin-like metallopeptidase domain-containing protein [Mucilaginibacter sp. PAMB04274]|uniref:ArdC family protein n=1 Tax=Mucilaginibacter sp. PAMB04274 TaxID=3138568 RepID=UPI0031F65FB1
MTQAATTAKSDFSINQKDVYQQVTDTIIEQLEKGVVPWQKPFDDNSRNRFTIPVNFTTGKRYQGINIILLWAHAIKNNYQSDEWATFKQWNDKGERIRKGESAKTQLIIFYDTYEKEVDGELQKVPFAKVSTVYNRCQLQSYTTPETTAEDTNKIKPSVNKTIEIEQFIINTGAEICEINSGAYYDITQDKIFMPYAASFKETDQCSITENYLATLFHELTHWTGAKKRLDRLEKSRFGDQKYANEELVAEFGAAFLCSGFSLPTVEKGNHAAYIDNWLKVLREDNRAIFRAASAANKAVEYLNSLQPSF